MAKKVITEKIEEAVIVEESALSIAEQIAETLPIIPEVLFIDDKEYSIAAAEDLDKKADALLKKATPKTYSSVAIWEEVKALKQEAVKLRTTPDNKRKELSKPYQSFLSDVKSKTDAIGAAAKAVQDKLDAALSAKENHEAELARQEAEAKARRTEQRKELLRAVGGSYDFDSGKFTFSHNEGIVVADMQILEYDDPSWEGVYSEVKTSWDEEQSRIAEQKEKEDQERADLEAKAQALRDKAILMRSKELRFEGFEFDEALQSWIKGDTVIHLLAVQNMSDEDWDAKIVESNNQEPVQEVEPPKLPSDEMFDNYQTNVQPEGPEPHSEPVFDPIGAVIGGMVGKQEERVDELDGVIRKEFVFTKDEPFIDIVINKTFLRIYPDEFDSLANNGVLSERVRQVIRKEDMGLTLAIISFD